METKVCSKCKEYKKVSEFYKRKDTKDGYRSDCKDCFNEGRLKYRLDNVEKIKERKKNLFSKKQTNTFRKKTTLEEKQS